MERFAEKLVWCFLFGIAFAVMITGMGAGIWLLCRIIGGLRDLGRSPAERRRKKAEREHPFRHVSLRGKAAWLICCLEQALCACGLDGEQGEPGSWYPVLALLWQVDELPAEVVSGKWLDEAADILPGAVLSCGPGGPGELSREERERFAAACALYREAGPRMAFLAPLMELVYRLVSDYWDDPAAGPDDSLYLLDQAGQVLEEYGIPLPPQDAVDFLTRFRAAGPGETFVGRQCSGIVGW